MDIITALLERYRTRQARYQIGKPKVTQRGYLDKSKTQLVWIPEP